MLALKSRGWKGKTHAISKSRWQQEIVARFHSQQAAEDALTDFVNRSKGGIPDDIQEISFDWRAYRHRQLTARQTNLCASNAEGNRTIGSGGACR